MARGNVNLDGREFTAAQAMRLVMGTTAWSAVPRDIAGAPNGTHDFDLENDTTTVAVEVSTIAVTTTVGAYARWSSEFPDLQASVPGLNNGWLLGVVEGGDARAVKRGLGGWLQELERLGETSVDVLRLQSHVLTPAAGRPPWYTTLAAMSAAGLTTADLIGELPAGLCFVSITGDGYKYSPTDASFVPGFVSDQLANEHASDVAKLGRATADRRALFLWLDAQSHLDVIRRLDHGLLRGELSGNGPVDEVWLGRQFQDGSVAVYRWSSDAPDNAVWDTFSYTAAEIEAASA